MKLRSRLEIKSGLFTGSMADVSFLLIIFFMVTAVFAVAKGIDLSLPEDPRDEYIEVEPEESVDVHVLANGGLAVDRKAMALEELLSYVGSKLSQDAAKPVLLRAERDATYGMMMTVLDELRQAPDKAGFEIRNLAIPTYREMNIHWLDFGWEE